MMVNLRVEDPVLDADFALFNVDQLVTVAPGCHPQARGPLGTIDRGALAARDGKIVWVGPMEELGEQVRLRPSATVLNPHGRTVLPGFVDPHTHPVYAGDRSADFYARALGARYHDQAEGGIMTTARATRASSEDALLTLAFRRSESFLRHGTTTIGARSGYGLTLDDELKSLRVLARLQHLQPLKIVAGFLPLHVLPPEYAGDVERYLTEVLDAWLPAARDLAVFCDVWSDEAAFTPEHSARVLRRGAELGYRLTAHANELGPGAGARLAAQAGALSVDHAVYLEDEDIAALRDHGTVAVLLPGTTFFLNSDHYAPARRLLDAGVTVALGTDFNPGTSHTQNMQFILTLAVLKLGMSPEEAIVAATTGSAQALGLRGAVGTLAPGAFCDLAVYRVSDYRHIPYHCAMNSVDTVAAGGRVVVRDGQVETIPEAAPV